MYTHHGKVCPGHGMRHAKARYVGNNVMYKGVMLVGLDVIEVGMVQHVKGRCGRTKRTQHLARYRPANRVIPAKRRPRRQDMRLIVMVVWPDALQINVATRGKVSHVR